MENKNIIKNVLFLFMVMISFTSVFANIDSGLNYTCYDNNTLRKTTWVNNDTSGIDETRNYDTYCMDSCNSKTLSCNYSDFWSYILIFVFVFVIIFIIKIILANKEL